MQTFSEVGQSLTRAQNSSASALSSSTLSSEEMDKIIKKERVKNEVHESCIAMMNLLEEQLEFIKSEKPQVQTDNRFKNMVFIKLLNGYTCWFSVKVDSQYSPSLLKPLLPMIINQYLQKQIEFFKKIVKLFENNKPNSSEVVYALFMNALSESDDYSTDDNCRSFFKEQAKKLKAILSVEDIDGFLSRAQYSPIQEKSYSTKMKNTKAKKKEKLNRENEGDTHRYRFVQNLKKDELNWVIEQGAKTPVCTGDSNKLKVKLNKCIELGNKLDSKMKKFDANDEFEFFELALPIFIEGKLLADDQGVLKKEFKMARELFEQYSQIVNNLHEGLTNIINTRKFDFLSEEEMDQFEGLKEKSVVKMREKLEEFHFPETEIHEIMLMSCELPLSDEKLLLIESRLHQLISENKGNLDSIAQLSLKQEVAQFVRSLKIHMEYKALAKEYISFLKHCNEIVDSVMGEVKGLENRMLEVGLVSEPHLVSELQLILEKTQRCLPLFEANRDELQQQFKKFEFLKDHFKKETHDMKLILENLENQQAQQKAHDAIEAFNSETKRKKEEFKRKVEKEAEENREKRRSEIRMTVERDKAEKMLRNKEKENRSQNKLSLLNMTCQKEFERFDELIEAIFEIPVPHYEIEFNQVVKLIEFLGGSVTPPGSGGSHRTVKLFENTAFCGLCSDLEGQVIEKKGEIDGQNKNQETKIEANTMDRKDEFERQNKGESLNKYQNRDNMDKKDNQMQNSNNQKEHGNKSVKNYKRKAKKWKVKKGKENERKLAEETTGIVKSHGSGAEAGKLSGYDVKNLRKLLGRCGLSYEEIVKARSAKVKVSNTLGAGNNVIVGEKRKPKSWKPN